MRISKKQLSKTKAQLKNKGSLFTQGTLHQMTFKDVQRRAIILGMPVPEVVNSDYHALASFIMNTSNQPDMTLIDKYDDWMDEQLSAMGYGPKHPMRNYQFRLGFIKEDPETGEKKTARVKGLKKPRERKKREKDAAGIRSGTKKSLTYQLASDPSKDMNSIIIAVQDQFPDAKDNTIKIWIRKCRKALQN